MNWDTVRDWLGTLGVLIGVGWAVFLYRVNTREKRMEQARLVTVFPSERKVVTPGQELELPEGTWPSGPTLFDMHVKSGHEGQEPVHIISSSKRIQVRQIEVANTSDELITNVWVEMHDGLRTNVQGSASQDVYVHPGGRHRFAFVSEFDSWPKNDDPVHYSVFFHDGAGLEWNKTVGAPLRRAWPGEKFGTLALGVKRQRFKRWWHRKRLAAQR